ncbi:MAG: TetR/AcrR family transcriptional regulator [Eggerthellaceae bacterium]
MTTMVSSRPRVDRRVLRTRKAIHTAFIELLTEVDFDKITITALAKRADIDRKTFYTHYSSTEDLFKDYIRTRLLNALNDIDIQDLQTDPALFCKNYLNKLTKAIPLSKEQHGEAFKHVPTEKLVQYFTNVIHEEVYARRNATVPPQTEQYIDLVRQFTLGGIFGAYISWIKGDSELDFSKVIDIISICATQGTTGALSQLRLSEPAQA